MLLYRKRLSLPSLPLTLSQAVSSLPLCLETCHALILNYQASITICTSKRSIKLKWCRQCSTCCRLCLSCIQSFTTSQGKISYLNGNSPCSNTPCIILIRYGKPWNNSVHNITTLFIYKTHQTNISPKTIHMVTSLSTQEISLRIRRPW